MEWQYFFGGSSGKNYMLFDRYYKAKYNGIHCEKHRSNTGTRYSIGDIDKSDKIFNTEDELKNYINKLNTPSV